MTFSPTVIIKLLHLCLVEKGGGAIARQAARPTPA